MAAALVLHNRLAQATVIALNICFAAGYLGLFRAQRADMSRVYETDGSDWIRCFGVGHDVIVRRADFVRLERQGFLVTVVARDGSLLIDPDTTGYKVLRSLAEHWESTARPVPIDPT